MFNGVYFRGIIPALIMVPVVAAWGVWALANIISLPIRSIKFKPVHDFVGLVVSVVMIVISYVVVSNFKPTPPANEDFAGTYKYLFQPYGPSLSTDFNSFLSKPYIPTKLPEIVINKKGLEGKTSLNDALGMYFKSDDTTIFDVSPFAAGGAVLQGAGILNNSRFVNLYHYYASLIHGMWGYQAGEFYGTDKLYVSPNPLADLSDWFGVKYAVLTPGFDPFYKYEAAGWKMDAEANQNARNQVAASGGGWGIEVWQNPVATGLVTATNRPAVLVIGNSEKGAYDNVFRTANLGAITYKNALIVQGSGKIDDYTLADLKDFGGVILNGYSYRSKNGAWNLIKQYLEDGGHVFVDTGWQYVSRDWQGDALPQVFPINKTSWKNVGSKWEGVTTTFGFSDFSKFEPLTYQGGPWNMAVAEKSDLKNGAKALVTKGDNVLMAEQNVGKGKIVWSGINIFSLTALTMNDSSASMLAKVTEPLFATTGSEDFETYIYSRPSPDVATIKFTDKINKPFWFLMREANSPYLDVKLTRSTKVVSPKVVKAGPGFIMVRVEGVERGDKLQIKEKLNFTDGFVAKALTVTAILFLATYLIIGERIVELINRLQIDHFTKNFTSSISSQADEENDY